MVALGSVPFCQEKCAGIQRHCQRASSRSEPSQTCERSSSTPKCLFSQSASCQHLHLFSSNTVVAFSGRRNAFCPSCVRTPILYEASNDRICPMCNRTSISEKFRTPLWCREWKQIFIWTFGIFRKPFWKCMLFIPKYATTLHSFRSPIFNSVRRHSTDSRTYMFLLAYAQNAWPT